MIIESEKAVCDSYGPKTGDSDESKFIYSISCHGKNMIFISLMVNFVMRSISQFFWYIKENIEPN